MKKDLSIVVVTGLSGSGKSTAVKALEDIGYYTVDNIPIFLAEKLLLFAYDFSVEIPKIAFVVDVRNKEFDKAYNFIWEIKNNYDADILFLEADKEVLLNRYKETRRKHPLGDNLLEAIEKEYLLLAKIKDLADFIINTSDLNVNELSSKIVELFSKKVESEMIITIQSFGFKYGIPTESDMVFDVRFLKNPHYIEKYRPLTGLNKEVKDYIFSDKRSMIFLRKLKSLLNFLIPNFMREGKKYLTISIGCTGGKHRSVAIAEFIYEYMLKKTNLNTNIKHRDIER